ncbi:hypothetical protein FB480_108149 [Agrobacterium vitis]|nr:hypothetical protein FB480_108149 [Agrobacterium vitis]
MERRILQRVEGFGEFFVSFHDFSFSGFRDEFINISVNSVSPPVVVYVGDHIINRLPHAAFYTDLYHDHHQGYFFRMIRPDLVSYGKLGNGYSDRGVVVMSANVDQFMLPMQIAQLHGPALDKLKAKQALLLIDQSHEGNPFDAELMIQIHHALQNLNVDEDLVFFINHTFEYSKIYNNWASEAGIVKRINIHYSNWYADGYFAKQVEFYDKQGGVDRYVEQQRFSAFSDVTRPKKFLALNYTPRPHRVLLMLELLQRNYLEAGFISFGGTRHADQYKNNFYDVEGEGFLWSMGKGELASYLPELDRMGACTLDEPFQSGLMGEAIRMSATSPDDFFANSYFSIVTESEFMSSDFMRVTEKTFKPIMRLHPFIPIGNYNTFGMLEDFGYKRFDNFFNSKFDEIKDAKQRFEMIMIEIDRLISMTDREIAELYMDTWDVLEHNLYTGYDYATSGMRRHNDRLLGAMIKKLREL